MNAARDPVERCLAKTQRTLRATETGDWPFKVARVPGGVMKGPPRDLRIAGNHAEALARAEALVGEDPRFEYMGHRTEEALWDFACKAILVRSVDHVPPFVPEHGREPHRVEYFMPVEFLTVAMQFELLGVTLLPPTDSAVPRGELGVDLERPVGAVARVEAFGTSNQRMYARARAQAEHALRVVRLGVHSDRGVGRERARFRLGHTYAIGGGGGGGGWGPAPDEPADLELSPELAELVNSTPASALTLTSTSGIDQQARLALTWLERSDFAAEPLTALLFVFFALESLIGTTDEGLKGAALVFNRALLGSAAAGEWADPRETYLLYDEVRSAAVHGEAVRDVDWRVVNKVTWDVRRALHEFLELAERLGVTTRRRLLAALHEHQQRAALIDWIKARDDGALREYAEQLDVTT